MFGMHMPRPLTSTLLIFAALLGFVGGCTNTPPSSTQRPGVAGSPIPTPTATPSSYPIEELGSTFTEFCVTFTHPIKEDATSALDITSIPDLHGNYYVTQDACSPATDMSGKPVRGHIRAFFPQVLTVAQHQLIVQALGAAYPGDAEITGQDVQGISVGFTVTPAAGSRLSKAGFDTVGVNQQDGADFAKILGVFGMTWVNDNHDVQVQYQGRTLTATNVARVQMILAKAAGVAPSEVRLLRFES